jgi:hypothetical protein
VSGREERDRVVRELEERRLIPSQAEQLRIRAQAQQLARAVCHLEGEERKRNVALEAKYRQLSARARNGESVEWPDE